MGMFSRLSDIIQANINSMLDKAEEPNKMVALMISEMQDALTELRCISAKYLAEQKTLQRKTEQLNKKVSYWQGNAETAMSKGREDLARAALIQKQSIEQELSDLAQAKDELDLQIQTLREDTARLNEKLAEAKLKQKSLQMRHSSANVRLNAKSITHSDKIDDVMMRFDRYENRIDELEAQIDSYEFGKSKTLQQEFVDMESEEKLNAELEALRKKVA